GCYGNAVGLRNPGMEKGVAELRQIKKGLSKYLIVSLSASTPEDFITLVKKFAPVSDIMELNFSCPHAAQGYGASIGSSAAVVKFFMEKIRKATAKLLFPKLTPNTADVGAVAAAAVAAGADGLVAINTVGPEVYYEPHSGKPILANPPEHKGGKSGLWIKERALTVIKEIRKKVGSGIPLIGMGGVATGKDVAAFRAAGADVVGVGSSLARVSMTGRAGYLTGLKQDAVNATATAERYLCSKPLARYRHFKITRIIDKTDTLRIMETAGRIDYEPGQFAFLWLPELPAEKPFALACNNPLTFLIRKKAYDKARGRGLVTHALFQLKKGDELFMRGPYSKGAPVPDKKNAFIIAGGSGMAIVPSLVKKLFHAGIAVKVYAGVTTEEEVVFNELIRPFAGYYPVADQGKKGRVIDRMEADLQQIKPAAAVCYNIGPVALMSRAAACQHKHGVHNSAIFFSLETYTMCGIGICGECVCGGKLTCMEGTFVSKKYLDENHIDPAAL
ncbi:MAG TPA: dihydroorotate dehydrogenase, partial [Spirochaetota bacterium]|nr:dihydroorotate dehydrogenase [Spirochaetota bacterium]